MTVEQPTLHRQHSQGFTSDQQLRSFLDDIEERGEYLQLSIKGIVQDWLAQCADHGRDREANRLYLFSQIKEITGVDDEHLIQQAITACQDEKGKYKVDDVVAMLLGEDFRSISSKKKSVTPIQPVIVKDAAGEPHAPGLSTLDARARLLHPGKAQPVGQQEVGAAAHKSQSVIDLTSEGAAGTDDLQKALAASLHDQQGILGGQVSREEQDISRVLEQSLAESKAGTKRKRGDLWFVDPLNPHERKRQDGCPVGLKNVGNTCWFSAVIQSLFHIRKFRHLVLNFRPPKDPKQGNGSESRNLRFMDELRYLFALMMGSHKKYVDPSKAVEILKEAFSSSTAGVTDSQQDVSEFQHKLLDWLEDAFKSDSSRPSTPDQSAPGEDGASGEKKCRNPMVELFYGEYRAEGTNEGKGFSNDETFGQFPLQVNGFRDIHESLEAATAQGEIETVSSDTTQTSGQELWFTGLPPVLTFELSRFQFNQQLGRPEKIHNKIEFPQIIYMDRYMGCNKTETRQRRERVKKLREELTVLNTKLNRFNHYGSGSKKVPLQDVLSYALEFAQSKPDHASLNLPQDVEMESPRPHSSSSSMQTDSPIKSPATDVTMAPATPPRYHRGTAVITSPAPRDITEAELKVLQDCLHRWRTEVEQDVRELQDNINVLEDTVNKMYSDEAMQRFPYQLHAVLVHEGQAASGHYWAYIFNNAKEKWLKFNDITVSEASWEELVKESVGGYHNASAYCLMYVDKSRLEESDLIDETQPIDDLESLPNDLKDVVTIDNKKFAQEITDWDKEQARKAAGESEVSQPQEHKPGTSTSTIGTQTGVHLPVLHACTSQRDTIEAISSAIELESFSMKDPSSALERAVQSELKRVEQITKTLQQTLPAIDLRLQHPVVYLTACNAPRKVRIRMMYEQFAYCTWVDTDERAKLLQHYALQLLQQNKKSEEEKFCQIWHEKYDRFRKVVFYFVQGLRYYHEDSYEKALPYFMEACMDNRSLIEHTEFEGMSSKLLAFYRRQCMLHVNTLAAQQFENQEDVGETLEVMNTHVLPCLQPLLNSSCEEDMSAVEEIREKWCAFLGQEVGSRKIEKLQDFMSKLFDPPLEIKPPVVGIMNMSELRDLHSQYCAVMDIAIKNGYIEKALQAK